MPQTKEELFARRTKAKPFAVEEYGDFYIRRMTLDERKYVDEKAKTASGLQTMAYVVVVGLATDEAGERMFKNGEEDQVTKNFESPLVDALAEEILAYNKIGQEAKAKAKQTAVDAKNS